MWATIVQGARALAEHVPIVKEVVGVCKDLHGIWSAHEDLRKEAEFLANEAVDLGEIYVRIDNPKSKRKMREALDMVLAAITPCRSMPASAGRLVDPKGALDKMRNARDQIHVVLTIVQIGLQLAALQQGASTPTPPPAPAAASGFGTLAASTRPAPGSLRLSIRLALAAPEYPAAAASASPAPPAALAAETMRAPWHPRLKKACAEIMHPQHLSLTGMPRRFGDSYTCCDRCCREPKAKDGMDDCPGMLFHGMDKRPGKKLRYQCSRCGNKQPWPFCFADCILFGLDPEWAVANPELCAKLECLCERMHLSFSPKYYAVFI